MMQPTPYPLPDVSHLDAAAARLRRSAGEARGWSIVFWVVVVVLAAAGLYFTAQAGLGQGNDFSAAYMLGRITGFLLLLAPFTVGALLFGRRRARLLREAAAIDDEADRLEITLGLQLAPNPRGAMYPPGPPVVDPYAARHQQPHPPHAWPQQAQGGWGTSHGPTPDEAQPAPRDDSFWMRDSGQSQQ